MSDREGFWEQREQVERFAAREPDHRLQHLIEAIPDPAAVRVLDLGCAGGRNAVLLAERGFDLIAMDASTAMVEATRERVAAILGPEEAERRVRRGRMDDLSRVPEGSIHLLVALGLYHNAQSREEWDRALDESVRVLAPGGHLLVAVFTPRTDLTGEGVRAVPGEPSVYEGFPGGRVVLVEAAELDRDMARRGLVPAVPTETVEVTTERGRRVTVNGLYVRRPASGATGVGGTPEKSAV